MCDDDDARDRVKLYRHYHMTSQLTLGEMIEMTETYVMSLTVPQILIILFVLYMSVPSGLLGFGRPTIPRREERVNETTRRRHITKLRATSKLFPPPYPNGWYRICLSSDVKKGEVIPITAFGQELVVFRGQNGKLGVLNAFCPHLGTHLGHGGTVENDNVVHFYSFFELHHLLHTHTHTHTHESNHQSGMPISQMEV